MTNLAAGLNGRCMMTEGACKLEVGGDRLVRKNTSIGSRTTRKKAELL